MSAILGINAFGQNPSACLLLDGKLVSFSHEERFNRIKNSDGLFPGQSIKWCLQSNKITLQDISRIAVNWDCNKYPITVLMSIMKYNLQSFTNKPKSNSIRSAGIHGLIDSLNLYTPKYYKQKLTDSFRMLGFKGNIPKVQFVGHHLTHAYQAYYHSPYKDAIILVADGSGEDDCVSGYVVKDGVPLRILHYPVPYSLGWYFGAFTAYFGFKANSEEGKLMGLAAFGESNRENNQWLKRFDRILKVNEDGFELNPYYFKMGANDYHPRFTNALVDFITSFDADLTPIGLNEMCQINGCEQNRYLLQNYIDLAYAVQTRLEEAVVCLAKRLVKQTNILNLCLAGGVFMNCKANGEVWKQSGIRNLFIHPASSDDGSAIGAAMVVAQEFGCDIKDSLNHVQYGASFTNDEIRNCLDSFGLNYKDSSDICKDVADLIGQGKYVGWFNGSAEMGARALGGRSIIASPAFNGTKEKINRQVKRREMWRPYCPSIIYEAAMDYLVNELDSPFMICTNEAKNKLRETAPSTVHVDNTVRPQTVHSNIQPKWYDLLNYVKATTGHPVLLNTSFNASGEPIVNSPFDAIRTFYSTGLHAIALGDFLIIK